MFPVPTPWASLSVSVANQTNIVEALQKSGANFRTEVTPAWVLDGELALRENFIKVKGENFIRRTDNGAILGRCGKRWHPMHNVDAFSPFQPLVDSGAVSLDTIGMLGGGRKVWMLVKINHAPLTVVNGDKIEKYFLVINGHDGASSIMLAYTPIRFLCANMLPKLLSNVNTQLLKVCHGRPSKTKTRLESAYQALSLADIEFMNVEEALRELAHTQTNASVVREYFIKALKLSDSGKSKVILSRLTELFEVGYGNNIEGVRGTLYAAYNAVTQFLNYERGRTTNTRITSLWFGPNAADSKRAFELALKLAV